MEMTNIIDSLVQEIERGAFPNYYAKGEYRRRQFQALLHMNWLEGHLGEEELAHLEKALEAELQVDTLEREAIIRTALAVGIRLALAC